MISDQTWSRTLNQNCQKGLKLFCFIRMCFHSQKLVENWKYEKMTRGQKHKSILGQRMSENSYFLSPKCQRKSCVNQNMKTRLRRYSLDALDFMSSEKVSKFLHVKKFINGLKSRSNRSIEIWIQILLFGPPIFHLKC